MAQKWSNNPAIRVAFIGGLLSNRVIGEAYGFWGSVVIATVGAVILLVVANLFSGKRLAK
jgi:uncharacterized membrane protein YeaQ/YmgE (transglycosylase-associated protein family)